VPSPGAHEQPPAGDEPDGVDPDHPRTRLRQAAAALSRYGSTLSASSREPLFAHLPELTGALRWASEAGDRSDVEVALTVADALGATWEQIGKLAVGRAALDALLEAVQRTGVPEQPGIAVVLRRRARLAMRARADDAADLDLQRAFTIATRYDDQLAIRVMLDRADLAMSRGDRAAVDEVVPELVRRTEASGDPLLQAMGRNRAGWAAVGRPDLAAARDCYERAWAMAELHEDPIVESRTAAGLALVATLIGDHERARRFWARALELAQQLHDRGFALSCLDGVAALLAVSGAEVEGVRLARSTTAVRESMELPRDTIADDLNALVLRRGQVVPHAASLPLWPWSEALAVARQQVAEPK
jgi:tetratricopeptide (TPR) repeat protein